MEKKFQFQPDIPSLNSKAYQDSVIQQSQIQQLQLQQQRLLQFEQQSRLIQQQNYQNNQFRK